MVPRHAGRHAAFAPGVFSAARRPVLDAGCGTGRNIVDLVESGPAVGVDLSLQALGFAREEPRRSCARRGGAAVPRGDVRGRPLRDVDLHGARRRAGAARPRASSLRRDARVVGPRVRRARGRARRRGRRPAALHGKIRGAFRKRLCRRSAMRTSFSPHRSGFLEGDGRARTRREEVQRLRPLSQTVRRNLRLSSFPGSPSHLAGAPAVRRHGARPRGKAASGGRSGHEHGGEVARVVRPVVQQDRVARRPLKLRRGSIGKRRSPFRGRRSARRARGCRQRSVGASIARRCRIRITIDVRPVRGRQR